MKSFKAICLGLLILMSTGTLAVELTAVEPTVIVLSWDGMRHDYPDLAAFPGLQRLEQDGLRARALTPVFPSSTFPTHVSMATGAPPGVHGIMDNQFFDRKKGSYSYDSDANWIDAEPVWIAAERQGIKAATFFWVGSETDWRGQASSYRRAPFSNSVSEAEKVDQIIAWLDLPEAKRPHLIMSYWHGVDSVAHLKGPNHADISESIHTQDTQLVRLLSALDERNLWSSTTLIVLGDHGMTEVNQLIDLKALMADHNFDVQLSGRSAVQHLFLNNKSIEPDLHKLLVKQDNIKVYRQSEIPKTFNFLHPTRIGDLIITTEPPYGFGSASSLKAQAKRALASINDWKFGAHGYAASYPDMSSVFFAMGRGVDKNKTLDKVHQLQVAPTVTQLLGIKPPLQASRAPLILK